MSDITLSVTEEEPVALKIVEAALKPEQEKNVEPMYESQTVLPDAGCVLSAVHVGAIPPIILQNKTVTPTKQEQTVTADDGYDGLGAVVAEPIQDEYIIPTGSKVINITENGTTLHDVTDYADAEIIADVNTDPAKGLVFGDYDADGYPTSARFVGAWDTIPERFFYNDSANYYRTLEKITHITVPEGVTAISVFAFSNVRLTSITLPSTLTSIGNKGVAARNLSELILPASYTTVGVDSIANIEYCERVVMMGDVVSVARFAYENTGRSVNMITFDFRHCTSVPPLENTNAFYAAVAKKFIVPDALLSDWQAATNWVGIPNATWEGV